MHPKHACDYLFASIRSQLTDCLDDLSERPLRLSGLASNGGSYLGDGDPKHVT